MDDFDDEELVGTEDESKNWKGIIISLVVIVFICSMIVMAIALVTPAKVKEEPGDPFLFSQLKDKDLQANMAVPTVHMATDGSTYMIHVWGSQGNYVAAADAATNDTKERVVISAEQIEEAGITGQILDMRPSPNGRYLLLKLAADGRAGGRSYALYDTNQRRWIADSHFSRKARLGYAGWIGQQEELIYVTAGNELLYKQKPPAVPETLTTGTDNRALVVPSPEYTDAVMNSESEAMIWPSPYGGHVVYSVVEQSMGDSDVITKLYTFDKGDKTNHSYIQVDLESDSFLTSVTWVNADKFLSSWISKDFSNVIILLCSLRDLGCTQNLKYDARSDLTWVDSPAPVVVSPDQSHYFLILPDPAYPKYMYRHLAAVKMDVKHRTSPEIKYLTTTDWSDKRIVGITADRILYLSTGGDHANTSLYSLSLDDTTMVQCLTCQLTNCSYVEARLSGDGKNVLVACLGPALPSSYLLATDSLKEDSPMFHQLRKEAYRQVNKTLEKIKLPVTEFVSVPLGGGHHAAVKLVIPAVVDRKKIYKYGLVVVLNSWVGEQQAVRTYPDLMATFLAKNQSYILAYADVRGSANRGEKFLQGVGGKLGVKDSEDVKRVIKYFEKNADFYRIDKAKMALMAKGYGGFVALHALQKTDVRCGVLVSSITDVGYLGELALRKYMGSESREPTRLEYSEICEGDDCSQSHDILLVHGTKDEKVPYENSVELMRKLQLAGVTFRQQIYPGVGHNIETSEVSEHYYQTVTHYLAECFSVKCTTCEDNSK